MLELAGNVSRGDRKGIPGLGNRIAVLNDQMSIRIIKEVTSFNLLLVIRSLSLKRLHLICMSLLLYFKPRVYSQLHSKTNFNRPEKKSNNRSPEHPKSPRPS